MKKNFLQFFSLVKEFNYLIYQHVGNYHPFLAKATIGFIYGAIAGILIAYFQHHILYLFIYGFSLLFITYMMHIITFNKDVISYITGVSSIDDILLLIKNIIDNSPLELISFIFFLILFFIIVKKYG